MPPKKSKKGGSSAESSGGDWLASLARQSTASDVVQSTSKRKGAKGGAQQSPHHTTTKEERIQRREQKKLERQERKRVAEEKRDAKKLLLLQKKRKRKRNERGGTEQIIRNTSTSPIIDEPRKRKGKRGGMTEFSKRALVKLCNNIESTVAQYDDTSLSSSTHQGKKHKKHKSTDQNDDNTAKQLIINGVPADPKGKATKSSTLRPDSKELQPRIRDYNGQGLVRPSLFLPLNDPSFVPKLELEFAEHIPGFFGKAKTKAAKKQADENMLWKRCLKAKEEEEGGSGGKKKKKKKNRVGGEGRFESMIRQDVM